MSEKAMITNKLSIMNEENMADYILSYCPAMTHTLTIHHLALTIISPIYNLSFTIYN